MRSPNGLDDSVYRIDRPVVGAASMDPVHLAIIRECFELFHSLCTGIARLSIDTSNDLFEMDPRVTMEEVSAFRSKRGEWLERFDASLRELFEKRMAGNRRKGRRPDPLQVFDSLRVMSDNDTSKQSALEKVSKRLEEAAETELAGLDYRVGALFGEPPGRDPDNPFAPAYLLDAIGVTSRSLYDEPRIWKPLMERMAGDFVPAINKTYIQLNRLLAHRRIHPEIGAMMRARSDLRPADDSQFLPVLGRLLNEIHPYFQAWRTLSQKAAAAANYRLAPLETNPYVAAAAEVPRRQPGRTGNFPQLNAMMVVGTLAPVLEALDYWQRRDPMAEHLRVNPSTGFDSGATPVNRIPWIHSAVASLVSEEGNRNIMDVVGFLFDYIFHDQTIPPRFRMIFDRLQVPILKVALMDPGIFTDKAHVARRLLDTLANAAIGAGDDERYGNAFEEVTTLIVDSIRREFVLDVDVFAYACERLAKFVDEWSQRAARAMQPQVDAGLAAETRDADRSRVRGLIRDKFSGIDVPFDVRVFVGTVWADYLTRLRETEGTRSETYIAAVKVMDDMLWSIAAKRRAGQRARLSTMIPSIVRSLRAGAAALRVGDEQMQRFLDALYDLHMAAIKPEGVKPALARDSCVTAVKPALSHKEIGNLYDFATDLILGTWLMIERDGARLNVQLRWISPWRATYVFTSRSGSVVIVFTPEELAWEMSTGRVTLILEPVPLFDRAMSATLDYLAGQKAKQDAAEAAANTALPPIATAIAAAA